MCYRPNAHSNGRKKKITISNGFDRLSSTPPFPTLHLWLATQTKKTTRLRHTGGIIVIKGGGGRREEQRLSPKCARSSDVPSASARAASEVFLLLTLQQAAATFFFFFHLRERQRGRHFSFSECGTAVLSTSCRRASPPRYALVNATLGLCSAASKNLTGHV